MYGKTFESQYEGSMVGAGMNVFAVWNYAIAKCKTGVVELNPKLLAFILGGTEDQVVSALTYLCAPDPASRSKEHDGKRLIKEGEYQYRLVNWGQYQALKKAEDLKEYNREQQEKHRAKVKAKEMAKAARGSRRTSGRERAAAKAYADGDSKLGDKLSEP